MTDLPNLGLNLPDRTNPDTWGDGLDAILRAIDANMAVVKIDLNGTNQGSLAIPNFNKILFSHAAIDTQGWFDATNKRIKPNVPCLLLVLLQTAIDDANSGTLVRSGLPAIAKNGTITAYGTEVFMTSASVHQGRGFAWDFISCDGFNDYIEGQVYAATGTSIIFGDVSSTRMAVMRLK